jgi:hypothetical protein
VVVKIKDGARNGGWVRTSDQVRELGARLDPDLRDFIDRAIVPILVKEYLAITEADNELARECCDAAHFVSNTAARELRVVRP